jgi:hypothetical protein
MGRLMRRFWLPICTMAEVAERRNENGKPPIGLDRDDHTTMRSVNDTTIGSDEGWRPQVADARATSRPSDGAFPSVVVAVD